MKKILIKIIALLLILFVCDRSLAFVFRKFIFDKTLSGESGGNINYLIKYKKNVDFIILGSSRAKRQIDPALLTSLKGSGYNAGVNGSGKALYNNALLEIILHNKIRPKAVLFQTDVINYIEKTKKNELIYLYPYLSQSDLLQHYSRSLGYEEDLKMGFSLYKYNGKLFDLLFNYLHRKSVVDNNGFVPLTSHLDTTQRVVTPDTSKKESKLQISKLNALSNIIALCKANNIKLYIILPPSYNNTAFKRLDIDQLLAFIKSKTNDKVINMTDITKLKDLQNAENWNDPNHLNALGAAKFSRQLSDSLANAN